MKVKISGACITKRFNCTKEYIRNVCHGKCCTGSNKVLISLLPNEELFEQRIGNRVKEHKLQPNSETKKCPHLKRCGFCSIHFTKHKPFGCIVSPFTINKNNTIVIRYRYMVMKCCGSGEPSYKTFRKSLVTLFGEEKTDKITEYYENGNTDDMFIDIDDAIVNRMRYLDSLKH